MPDVRRSYRVVGPGTFSQMASNGLRRVLADRRTSDQAEDGGKAPIGKIKQPRYSQPRAALASAGNGTAGSG